MDWGLSRTETQASRLQWTRKACVSNGPGALWWGRVALCHQGNPRDPGQGRGLKRNRLHPGFSLRFCPGLKELTLSANPGITPKGWSRLAIAVAHSSQVRVLNLDYNPLGEAQGSPLRVSPPHPHPRTPVQDPLVVMVTPPRWGGGEGRGIWKIAEKPLMWRTK